MKLILQASKAITRKAVPGQILILLEADVRFLELSIQGPVGMCNEIQHGVIGNSVGRGKTHIETRYVKAYIGRCNALKISCKVIC